MSEYLIVVTDGERARFFTLEPVSNPRRESGPRLTEQGDLVNPEKGIPGRELYDNVKSGRGRAPVGGPAHGYDDHRSVREDGVEKRFARSVIEHAVVLSEKHGADSVILTASARMLGFLRRDLEQLQKKGLAVTESVKDLTRLPALEIHNHLAKMALLPPRRPPGQGA